MEEWKEYKLGDMVQINAGKRLPKGVGLSSRPSSHPYIKIRSLGSTRILELNETYEYVDDVTQKTISRYIVNSGDILLSIVGTIGLTGIVGDSLDNANLTENCVKIIGLNGLNSMFLYYFLLSQIGQKEIQKGIVGAVQPKLPIKNIQDITIKIPSITGQERIAKVLSSIDDKIELNNRINHNLEEQARNIFLSYIDCDCVECPFSDLITVGSGGTPRTSESRFWNGDIPFFSPKDVSNSCFTLFTEKLITKDGLNNCNSSLYHENTTFITARGTVGKISLAGVSMAMNQSCFALTSKDNTPYFAYFLTERVVESLKKKANGAVFDAINSKDILQELVRVPNRDVIFQIEDRIRPYMNSIRFKSIENLYLTDTRDTLLPKLLSGELKINDLTC